jgi:Fur family transcriptional regulator, zinc uptake regulator
MPADTMPADTMPAHPRRDHPFHESGHDHGACVEDALDRAAALCARRGARLTELRRQVLERVWRGHAPVGAYEILGELRDGNRAAAPPTVYRALDFLIEQGLVHRIESLNAYVGCSRPDGGHVSQFLICTGCGAAAELEDRSIARAVRRRAGELGFAVERQTIEVRGRCPRCQVAGE